MQALHPDLPSQFLQQAYVFIVPEEMSHPSSSKLGGDPLLSLDKGGSRIWQPTIKITNAIREECRDVLVLEAQDDAASDEAVYFNSHMNQFCVICLHVLECAHQI